LAHSYKPEIPAIFGRNSFCFRVDGEDDFLFRFFLFFLLLLSGLLALPGEFLALSSSVLDEDFLDCSLIGVNGSEIKAF
jgi:hypothetical protein